MYINHFFSVILASLTPTRVISLPEACLTERLPKSDTSMRLENFG